LEGELAIAIHPREANTLAIEKGEPIPIDEGFALPNKSLNLTEAHIDTLEEYTIIVRN
jgi:hypothetical protein